MTQSRVILQKRIEGATNWGRGKIDGRERSPAGAVIVSKPGKGPSQKSEGLESPDQQKVRGVQGRESLAMKTYGHIYSVNFSLLSSNLKSIIHLLKWTGCSGILFKVPLEFQEAGNICLDATNSCPHLFQHLPFLPTASWGLMRMNLTAAEYTEMPPRKVNSCVRLTKTQLEGEAQFVCSKHWLVSFLIGLIPCRLGHRFLEPQLTRWAALGFFLSASELWVGPRFSILI